MAVERRGQRRQFLYHSKRVDGRTVKQYVGSLTDPIIMVIARIDRLSHADRAADREAAHEECDSYAALEPIIRVTSTLVARFVWGHLHRCRVVAEQNRTASKENTMTVEEHNMPKATITRDEFDVLVARVSAGGRDALDELRRVLRANPSIYRALGDVSQHVQDSLIEQIAGQPGVATLALRLRIGELRDELRAAGVTPLECMLVEQVLTTWLDFNLQQVRSAQPRSRKGDAKHWEQRLDRAQRRHLAAARALTDVRTATRNRTDCAFSNHK